jgi:hypothetical protein
MNRTALALAAVTLSLGVHTLRAQNTLDTTFAVRGTPRLTVTNHAGTIVVRSWNRAAVRLQAEYDRAQVEAEVSPTRVAVRTLMRRGQGEVEYVITVPVGTAVEVSGISTDVGIAQVCGAVSVNITSGDVDVDCAQGDVVVQAISGDVSIAGVRSGMVDVGTTSGDLVLRDIRATVNARSVSGEIDISNVDAPEVTGETVSGEIRYSGRIADGGRYRFEAHSGDVAVHATNNFNATVTVSTFSGEFDPTFPITITQGVRSSREWDFTVGTGSARMTLRSFSGTITLSRGGAAGGRNDREDDHQ